MQFCNLGQIELSVKWPRFSKVSSQITSDVRRKFLTGCAWGPVVSERMRHFSGQTAQAKRSLPNWLSDGTDLWRLLITLIYRIRRSIISAAGCFNKKMITQRYTHGLYRFGARGFSTSIQRHAKHYQFVVAGGGSGGLSIGSTLCRKFPKSTAIIEPSEVY